jgi:hypothetical protein
MIDDAGRRYWRNRTVTPTVIDNADQRSDWLLWLLLNAAHRPGWYNLSKMNHRSAGIRQAGSTSIIARPAPP